MIIGLTGTMGSGKSSVSARLARLGARVLDADEICRELTYPRGEAIAAIAEAFPGVVDETGTLDRRALALKVFSEKAARERLNAILHPAVLERLLRESGEGGDEGKKRPIIWDVPLLIECGWQVYCDEVWLVLCDAQTRIRRIAARDGMDEAQARKRIEAQMSDVQKAGFATHIIHNDGTLEALAKTVDELYERVAL